MGGPSSGQDIFDVRKIRRLIELMNEHDLQEMDLRQGDTRIQLRRGGENVVTAGPGPVPQPVPAPVYVPASAPASAAPSPPAAPADDPNATVIKSPMVGTFYSAPDPDSAPYVEGWRSDRQGNDGLHRGSHEGLQRDSGRSRRHDHGRLGRER